MRLFTKSLSAGVKCPMRILLLASLFFLSPVLHTHAFGATAAPAVVNDQYKFSQISFTPFVYDQFSGFDYAGYQLHRVYVHTVNETDYVKRIFGNAAHPAGIHAPAGIYNNNFCTGPTSGGAPPSGFFVSGYNAYEFDSWVGIGLSHWPDEFIGEEDVVIDSTALNPWSDNFVLESMSSGNYGPVDIYLDDADTEGGWRLNSDDALNGYAGDDYQAIVMQLMTDSAFTWTLNAEIWIDGDPNNAVIVTQTYNGTSLGSPVIEGCTDVTACNYYDLANTDNGSCDYPDPYYDCDDVCLNDTDGDGVCNELEIEGCTEPLACNYNAAATEEDSSCVFAEGCETCSGATDGTGTVVDNDADDDGVCNDDEIVGCQTPEACNYNSAATDPGTCLFVDGICETCSGETNGTGTVVDNDSDDDGVCNADEIVGCQDSTACNYDVDATDAGSCIYASGCDFCSGATDGTGTVQVGDTDGDGVCDVDEIAGCQDVTACNYNALATDSDGSCDFCSCGQLTGLSPYSLTVEEHAVDGIPGHTTYRLYVNMEHPNDYLNSIYGESPGSVSEPFVLTSTSTPNWYQNDSAGSNLGWEVLPITLNYIPELAYDSWMTIGLEFGPWNDFYTVAGSIGSGFWPAFNAGEDININSASGFSIYNSPNCDLPPGEPVGSCSPNHPAVAGDDGRVLVGQITTTGTLSGEFSVSILQNGNYGSGIFHTEHFQFNGVGTFSADSWNGAMSSNYQDCGCTDATALNYDDEALYDDGDCIPAIPGCMDNTACNYMDTATVDSGACVFPTGCELCSGETDGSGYIIGNDDDNDSICDDVDPCVGAYDALGICNGDCTADADSDGVCDDVDDCVGALDALGVCNGDCTADADSDGICDDVDDCIGTLDALGVCNGSCAADADSDGVCDDVDDCVGSYDALGVCNGSCAADADNDDVCDDVDDCVGDFDALGVCNGDCAADADADGICDDVDDCIGSLDALGVCNGDCTADADSDGICDDVDDCVGAYDALGVCNGTCAADADDDDVCDDVDDCVGAYDALGDCNGTCTADVDADGICDDVDDCVGSYDALGVCNGDCAADEDNDGICDDVDDCVGTYDALGVCNGSCPADADSDGICDDVDDCVGAFDALGVCNGTCEADVDADGVCDADEIVGCQNESACNYDPTATDPGECFIAAPYYDCYGECLNDFDGDGICDPIEDMLFDATFEGYQDGYLDGIGDCTGGPEYCGEGTVWSPDFQMCVEDSACPGDLDGDAVVGTNDLLLLLMDYGFACD